VKEAPMHALAGYGFSMFNPKERKTPKTRFIIAKKAGNSQ